MNNNKLDEPALLAGCKGVFSKASYVTIGTKDQPEDYVKKGQQRPSFLGKQFATVPPKDGKTVEVYFDKSHKWISQGDKYVDRIRYIDSQKEKKKGFLTSDFSKRDEFTNTIRTEQWREQLSEEDKYSKKALDLLSSAAGGMSEQMSPTSTSRRQEDEPLLYDLVYEKEDKGFTGASKTHRDTKNRTMLGHDRALGDKMTTTNLAFQPPQEHSKPEYARRPLIRDTFYRKTNILFPAGCSAESTA